MNLLITFGALRVYIDEVRFITNRSTGLFGYKLLQEALRRQYVVRAVVGITNVQRISRVEKWIEVEEYSDLKETLLKECNWADIIIMAAAVPDFIPGDKIPGKIPRKGRLNLELYATESIIGKVSRELKEREKKIIVGMSLEKTAPIIKAQKKLKDNELDMVLAVSYERKNSPYGNNPVSIIVVQKDGVERFPLWKKHKIANYIFERLEEIKKGILN